MAGRLSRTPISPRQPEIMFFVVIGIFLCEQVHDEEVNEEERAQGFEKAPKKFTARSCKGNEKENGGRNKQRFGESF